MAIPVREKDRQTTKHDKKDHFIQLPTTVAFCVFLSANLLASIYAPIQDCDEVFNYWEPTHYLTHGFGLQTWEYSPEYAIRSWSYIMIHAIPSKIASVFLLRKAFEFYFVRGLLASACAGCEIRLFSTISRTMNPRIAVIFMLAMASGSGMFHASVAYLPSSFAMYTTMMGVAAFMDVPGGLKSSNGITWFGIGATMGWPFSAALILPFFTDELTYVVVTHNIGEVVGRVLTGGLRTLIIVPFQLGIDLFFYRRALFVPWRIVSYNVFGGSSRGPDIFGTEPWHFYIRNLLLNFNAWFLLALCAGPLLCIQSLFPSSHSTTRLSISRTLMLCTPFYMWLTIFSAQAHKEERFMYPAYPLLCINAAIALHIMLTYLGRPSPTGVTLNLSAGIKLLLVGVFMLFTVSVGVLRTLGTVSAYSAPLEIYKPLQTPEYTNQHGNVCLGKEWYRFPSSYFLPKNMRAKFIKSAFDGLLPGQFSEATTDFGLLPTWVVPPSMNDQNLEDSGKYIDIRRCSFMVDFYFPGSKPSSLEPFYMLDKDTWEELSCSTFLDPSQTYLLGRIFWLPSWDIVPAKFRRRWGRYCLLQRKSALK